MTHPARTMDFDTLYAALNDRHSKRLVSEAVGEDGLRLYCYTESCVYDRAWDDISMMARGLILDIEQRCVVATPFPKFFNIGEPGVTLPAMPFETFEKLDGSLIIIFHHNGQWKTATKGSFKSSQAMWAAGQLTDGIRAVLEPRTTYLCEAIYPENRIVVHYGYEGLVLLGAYRADGSELTADELAVYSGVVGWRAAKRHAYGSIADLLAVAPSLPATEEGFVIRFEDGLRVKLKGDEYCRIHRLVSRLTPLAMWEAMVAGDDLAELRRQVPEEFWVDFDAIIAALQESILTLTNKTAAVGEQIAGLSDKEVGLQLASFPADVRRLIFPLRRNGGGLMQGRTRELVFRMIRPTGNMLPGYRPSYAINRVLEEAA